MILTSDAAALTRLSYSPSMHANSDYRHWGFHPDWGSEDFEQMLGPTGAYANGETPPNFPQPGDQVKLIYTAFQSRYRLVWPSDPAHVFYRAFMAPFRAGMGTTIMLDRVSDRCVSIDRIDSSVIDGDTMDVNVVERTEGQPSFRGIGIQSEKSRFGTYPVESYMSVGVARSGATDWVPVSPYPQIEELIRLDRKESAELRLVSLIGAEAVLRVDTGEVETVLVSVTQHRTWFGRSSRSKKTSVKVEYWVSR